MLFAVESDFDSLKVLLLMLGETSGELTSGSTDFVGSSLGERGPLVVGTLDFYTSISADLSD